LQGQADNVLPGDEKNAGLTINPYYLPAGNPNALGGGLPYDLSKDPIDTIPRADQTSWPPLDVATKKYNGFQIDSTSLLPYAGSFQQIASQVLKADPRTTNVWNPDKPAAGKYGAWTSAPPLIVGSDRLVFGPMDAAEAARYGLSVASLQLPNRPNTFVGPTDASMTKALGSAQVDPQTGVSTSLDFTTLPDDAYPLTSSIYAAVDTNATPPASKASAEYASFIRYAAAEGQVRGSGRGQLPDGYVPLTDEQRSQATYVADILDGIVDPDAVPPVSSTLPAPAAVPSAKLTTATAAVNSPPLASPQTVLSSTDADAVEATSAPAATPLQPALGVALGAGVLGVVVSPFLLRRKAVGA
jgi:hypothetical protein